MAEGATKPIEPIAPIGLEEIRAARPRIADSAIRTPLLRLFTDAPCEIHLKLECLQPIGSFKLRGAGNAMALAPRDALAKGVYTASAGNMAQGVAWNARRLGIPCTVVVPDHAPQAKLGAIERVSRMEPVAGTPPRDRQRLAFRIAAGFILFFAGTSLGVLLPRVLGTAPRAWL